LGSNALEAQQIIQREAPWACVFVIPEGAAVTSDYRSDRVRIYYNTVTGLVTQIPVRG